MWYIFLIYMAIGVWHFGKVMQDVLVDEPKVKWDWCDWTGWFVIFICACPLWVFSMAIVGFFSDLDYYSKKGFRFF